MVANLYYHYSFNNTKLPSPTNAANFRNLPHYFFSGKEKQLK